MIRTLVRIGAIAALVGATACEEALEVTNPNNPETARVLATPKDAEALIGSYYRRWHDGVYRTLGSFHGMANIMSLQNYSSLANNCQNSRTPFSNASNSNAPGNTCQGEQQRLYFVEAEVNRVATSFIKQLDGGLSLGSPAQDARARAFAEFLRGASLGYLALFYDSAAVVSVNLASDDPGSLRGYAEVMDSSHAALQRAIDAAQLVVAGTDGFPLPSTWMPSPTNWTSANFVALVRSYRARFRANVARNPAERAAVNWALVIADAQNGIATDFLQSMDPTVGPFYTWVAQYDGGGLWHQMPPFVIGMGDGGTNYAAWVATPRGQRGAGNVGFFMDSPDLRFPQGATRTLQQTDFSITSCEAANTKCKRYFVNRPAGGDQFAGEGWGASNYDFVRYHSWVRGIGGTAGKGDITFFTKSELRLLEAEGQFRAGAFAAARDLVNFSRTAGMAGTPLVATGGGLPALVAADNTTPVPGGAACVPKVPNEVAGTVACGTLWEALKYEKRIETAFTHFAPWFLDMRGWGDLPAATALFWAVPYQDLQARGYAISAIYGAGPGAGNAPGSEAIGPTTYGW